MRPKFHRLALKVALIYGVTSAGWILFSDELVAIIGNDDIRTKVSIVKGWAFVLVTALLLYGVLRRIFIRLEREELVREQAETARRRSEQNYREIFNATNEAIFLHDAATGRILDVNDAMLRLYGYDSKEAALARQFEDLCANVPPHTPVEAQQKIRLAIEAGPQVFEWQARRKSGEMFWVEVSLRSSDIGGQGCILAVIREITERKRTETARSESEQKFSKVFHASPVAMSLTTREEGRYLDVNEEFLRSVEWSRHEVIGHTGMELNLWASPAQRTAAIAQLQAHGAIRGVELEFRAKSGRAVHVLWSAEEVIIGGQSCLLGSALDITERQRAEQALRESEESLRRLGDNLPNGFVYQVVKPPAGNRYFRYLSAGVERIHGITIAEVLKNPAALYDLVATEDRERLAEAEKQSYHDLSVVAMEVRMRPPSGSEIWLRFNSAPRRLADGSVMWDGVALDITASKQAEAQLTGQLEELQRWYRVTLEREDRVQQLKHEVNQLLTRLGEPSHYASQNHSPSQETP